MAYILMQADDGLSLEISDGHALSEDCLSGAGLTKRKGMTQPCVMGGRKRTSLI